MTVPVKGTTRVRFQDVKPYDAPASLDDLHGPRDGELVLPHHVHWGPRRDVNLGHKGDSTNRLPGNHFRGHGG